MYWLKNCEGVQLGLRGINAFGRMDHYIKAAMPTRDLTIEGGRGNILHGLRISGHAQEATIVNSDPALQIWCVSAQYESEGVEAPGITRFAFSPGDQLPTAEWVKEHEPEFADYAEWLAVESAKMFKLAPDGPEIAKLRATWMPKWIDAMRRGRFHDTPMTATAEQTFVVGGRDLTREKPEGAVPAPPSIPATDAPRYDRPLAFTQDAEFGKALIDAGADPTGAQPSDEAFARVMFGMSRDEVQVALDDAAKADADFRAARARKDESGMKAAKERIAAAVEKLAPPTIERDDKGRERPVKAKRGKLEVPAGRFQIERPLVLFVWDGLLGAGPEKTTLFSTKPITLIERRGAGGRPTIGNLALEGGRVGLDFLGADHGEPVSPTLHAYTAGANFFNIAFRGQSFAGLWVGNREPGVMGGAEHDQNKYVQLTFENTGDYGIYMNQPMLDKWLLLHCDFRGQKKAGVRIEFQNVMKGSIISCRFEDIDGPGFDMSGGNPEISYTPSLFFVDQCEFTECGNARDSAFDLGYCTLSSIARTRIVGKKPVLIGLRAAAQIYEDVTIDVQTAAKGAPVLGLRAVRDTTTARANGHILRQVKANGPVTFIKDPNADLARYDATMAKLKAQRAEYAARTGEPERSIDPIDFDQNPRQHERPPANGWNNPFLFYRCDFGETQYNYTLINADTAKGKASTTVAIE